MTKTASDIFLAILHLGFWDGRVFDAAIFLLHKYFVVVVETCIENAGYIGYADMRQGRDHRILGKAAFYEIIFLEFAVHDDRVGKIGMIWL